jgi:ubiquinol-cytochrome c reductase cytochrome b subunit
MGFLEGTLRVFPNWTWNLAGHTVAWNTLIPALVPLGGLFTLAAFWPFLEQWITGDRREHHINDRPRNAPTRTAIGIAAVTFWGIFWLEGANDVIADHLDISLYVTTEIARWAIFIGPVVAYIVTKRICLGLQRKDLHLLEHGVETGIIRQLPSGEYIEETRPVSEEALAVLEARQPVPSLPAGATVAVGDQDVPAPGMRGGLGRARERLNAVLTESVPADGGHGYGEHGNGHGNGHAEHAAILSGGDRAAEGSDDEGTGGHTSSH